MDKQQLPPLCDKFQLSTSHKLRIAVYSHDTMGLGHKRRNLLISQTLGASALDADILMISGMSEANNFSMFPGVDCLTLPALHKNSNGEYRSRRLDISISEIINLRSQVIRTTVESFTPDVLIVDNVPRGVMGELDSTLEYLHDRGQTYCILGLRDILDEPSAVRLDWQRRHNDLVIQDYYDAVWVYGDPSVYDSVKEYNFAPETNAKLHYMGYLDQTARLKFVEAASKRALESLNLPSERLILCSVGGGQDGAELAEVFAKTKFPSHTYGVLLTGPFMPPAVRQRLQEQADRRLDLSVLEYFPEPTLLIERADRVIAMGGYNTTCEILSFQKQALIVPRIKPRKEQLVRAERLQAMGLVDMLHPDRLSVETLSGWLKQPDKLPKARDRVNLDGLTRIPEFLAQNIAVTHSYI
ncbi:glycosyltransferase [Merismopedia glauca CCAP 1448/3]|uniref:Glycosyltransferase n=1 Tax=Merismopedia glauca CCAP 1448/3 TaxID=1296344 RepID=A0A2T1CA69_9CYAN|nr:glycosyltransferase [Merismopedia glauca CCAP 1448/3]